MNARSRDYCYYTCPKVDDLFHDTAKDLFNLIPEKLQAEASDLMDSLRDDVKTYGTERLRSALRECVDDLNSARDEIRVLTDRLKNLEEHCEYSY